MRAAQADQPSIFDGPVARALRAAGLAWACALLSACGSGGFSLEKAEVDRTFYTSNVSAPRTPEEIERHSDEVTIRNAVTSADVETLAGAPLPWANVVTGARGQVTTIVETKGKGTPCRSFSATRESFDGVGMFRGKACMVVSGVWRMESFEAL
ncbi:MAG: RT0821/Lpp0805 family surface protein [Pseudomonadota bacterium]|nr:RT0821/Lpp0805 family surface protein [Pseudomonadota bacterium]MDQ2705255.1 RT0821/Lpp0805 family surface protein [Pseudomonadota bacterium]